MHNVWRVIAASAALFLLADGMITNLGLADHLLPDTFRIFDARLHHTLKPNISDALAIWGHPYAYSTNSLGLRDSEPRLVMPRSEKSYRVLFLGDSVTEGLGAPWENTFVGLFARHCAELEVLNGALSSYSPSIYLNQVKRLLGLGIHLDHVVFYIDISDIQDEAAAYQFDAAGNVTDTRWSINAGAHLGDPPASVQWERSIVVSLMRKIRMRILPHFAFTRFLVDSASLTLIGAAHGAQGDARLVRSMWTVSGELPAGYRDLGVEGGIRKARDVMTAIADILHRNGVTFSLAVYPWPDQLQYDIVESKQVVIWRSWCEQNGCTTFVNHFPDFFADIARGDAHDTRYIEGDTHFSEAGHRLVADRLIKDLRSHFQPCNSGGSGG